MAELTTISEREFAMCVNTRVNTRRAYGFYWYATGRIDCYERAIRTFFSEETIAVHER